MNECRLCGGKVELTGRKFVCRECGDSTDTDGRKMAGINALMDYLRANFTDFDLQFNGTNPVVVRINY